MADTTRVMVYSAQDDYLFDVAPSEVYERIRTEEVNGAHSLTITATRELTVGNRLVVSDKTGKWREYVVTGVEEGHSGGGKYYAVWSIQYDLMGVTCDVMPGVRSPVSAAAALAAILDNTSQWSVGTVDVGTTGGASMWQRSAWDAISTLIEVWGGEIESSIEVDASGVVSRKVDYRSHVGSTTVTRRFDYGADLTEIRRKVADSVRYCRIVPLGAGSTDAVESADRKRVTITSVNDGKEYLQNDAVVPIARRPDGSGGWEYPTRFVIFDGVKTPEELLEIATRNLDAYTVPRVSYTASVDQFAEAGADLHGVEIGDDVDVVDKAFGGDGLRIRTRVVKLVTNELNPSSVAVTLGTVSADIGSHFSAIGKKIDGVSQALANEEGNTSAYLENILDNLNAEINATGGYTYLTDGQGIRTYDHAVTDPLVGAEATKVVEVKGGSIRIADSKTAQGAWEWRTVFVSGHIAADLVTAAQITAGYIGSAASGNYWNLDNGTLQIGGVPSSTVVSDAATAKADAAQAIGDAANAAKVATNYLSYSTSNGLDVGYSETSARTRINGSGVSIYDGDGNSALYAGLSGGSSIVRIGKTNASHANIDSSGLTFWSGQENAANLLARFGSTVQIGKSTNSHIFMDYRSFTMQDREGNEYIDFEDLRDEDGYFQFTDNFTGDGSKYAFSLTFTPNVVISATVNGVQKSYVFERGQIVFCVNGDFRYPEPPPSGSSVVITYKTVSPNTKAYSIGYRNSTKTVGPSSLVIGANGAATAMHSVAIGHSAVASGKYSYARGYTAEASGESASAIGAYTSAASAYQTVVGRNNAKDTSGSYVFIVGNGGMTGSGSNAFTVDWSGVTSAAGNVYTGGSFLQSSDRRLKEHCAYLGDDAVEFVRRLKPALFVKDGERHVGFYAQDVRDAEPHGWGTATVTESHADDGIGFDPLALDYTAIIAPLVAYAQSLESRISELEASTE